MTRGISGLAGLGLGLAGCLGSSGHYLSSGEGSIPTPHGLESSYDINSGSVHITWNAVNDPAYKDYLVYRYQPGTSISVLNPVNIVTSPAHFDTLYRKSNVGRGQTWQDTFPAAYIYEVRVRTALGEIGKRSDPLNIFVTSPAKVETRLNLSLLAENRDSLIYNSTVIVALQFRNPSRKVEKIQWLYGGPKALLKEVHPHSEAGEDTLSLVVTKLGQHWVVVKTFDNEGIEWADSIPLPPVITNPVSVSFIERVDTVYLGGLLHLKATAESKSGQIVKWEWDIGGRGDFTPSSGGDTLIRVPLVANSILRCLVRATDDHGNRSSDSIQMTIQTDWTSRWVEKARSPLFDQGGWVGEGRIYVKGFDTLDSRQKVAEFDPSLNTWHRLSLPDLKYSNISYLDGKLMTLVDGGDVLEFDPVNEVWSGKGRLDYLDSFFWDGSGLGNAIFGKVESEVFAVCGDALKGIVIGRYDSSSELWRKDSVLESKQNAVPIFSGGRLYLFSDSVYRYDPKKMDFKGIAAFLGDDKVNIRDFAAIESEGWVYFSSRSSLRPVNTAVSVEFRGFNAVTGKTHLYTAPLAASSNSIYAVHEGSIYNFTSIPSRGNVSGSLGLTVERFDLPSRTTTRLSPIRYGGFSWKSATFLNGKIYLFLNSTFTLHPSTVIEYVPE